MTLRGRAYWSRSVLGAAAAWAPRLALGSALTPGARNLARDRAEQPSATSARLGGEKDWDLRAHFPPASRRAHCGS